MRTKIKIEIPLNFVELRMRIQLILFSFLVMIPWPVLGIVLTYTSWEQADEIIFLFGGVTGIFLIPIFFIIPNIDTALGITILSVWCFVLLIPSLFLTSIRPVFSSNWILYGLQSGFACLQSFIGVLIIWGKYV